VSFVANMLVNILLRLGVRNTSGFRACKRETLEAILPWVKCNSYNFQVEMLQRAREHGFSLKEIPIVFRERAHGKSKLGKGEFSSFIKMLLNETVLKNTIFPWTPEKEDRVKFGGKMKIKLGFNKFSGEEGDYFY